MSILQRVNLGVIVLALVIYSWMQLSLAGCFRIPVEVHPAFTEAAPGAPQQAIPLPVAQQPATEIPQEDGTTRVVPDKTVAPTPPAGLKLDWGAILGVLGIAAGTLGGGWGMLAQRGIGILRTALVKAVEYGNEAEKLQPGDATSKENLQLKAVRDQQWAGPGVHEAIVAALKETKG